MGASRSAGAWQLEVPSHGVVLLHRSPPLPQGKWTELLRAKITNINSTGTLQSHVPHTKCKVSLGASTPSQRCCPVRSCQHQAQQTLELPAFMELVPSPIPALHEWQRYFGAGLALDASLCSSLSPAVMIQAGAFL